MRRIDITNGPYFPKVGDTVELTLLAGESDTGTVISVLHLIGGKCITLKSLLRPVTSSLLCVIKNGKFSWTRGIILRLHLILKTCPYE